MKISEVSKTNPRKQIKVKRSQINESILMEDPVYRSFKQVGRYIAERRMSEKEILQVFADAEAGMTDTATGANRTMLGRGKDRAADLAATIRDSVSRVLSGIQNSVPVSAVDTAYDQATDAIANLAGGQKGAVMQAIKKYRMLVKKYPKSAGFAKAALVAIAGLATGGAGLPAIAGLTYALDAAVKGEKLSSVVGKGAGAAALAWAAQAAAASLAGGDVAAAEPGSISSTASSATTATPTTTPTPDLPTYTVQSGDTLSQIARDNGVSVRELIGLNPQLADATGATGGQSMNPDVIFPGQEITLPPASGEGTYAGGVGTSAGTQADIASGQIPDSEISRRMAAGDTKVSGAQAGGAQPGDVAPTTSRDFVTDPVTGEMVPSDSDYADSVRSGERDYLSRSKIGDIPHTPEATQAVDQFERDRRFGRVSPGTSFGDWLRARPELLQQLQSVRESVNFVKLPIEQIVDHRSTVLLWTLNEATNRKSRSFVLSQTGVNTVFENIDRYRRALVEVAGVAGSIRPQYYRPDMSGAPAAAEPAAKKPGLLSRGLGKVGGALSTFGRQFTTNVTKEKLKMNWHQAGKPSDSDQLAAWLIKQGVPQEVVAAVYKKMNIPYGALWSRPAGDTGATAVRPVTRPATTTATLPAASTATAAGPTTTTTTPTAPAVGGANPAAYSYNASNIMSMPGMQKYATPSAAAKPTTANFSGPKGYGKTTTTVKPTAPVSVSNTNKTRQPAVTEGARKKKKKL